MLPSDTTATDKCCGRPCDRGTSVSPKDVVFEVFYLYLFCFSLHCKRCAETSVLCESKKVNRLREIHLPPVYVFFFYWTITQQRRAVIVLQEAAESQLWISAEFYCILLASMAAQCFLSVADVGTQGIYLFISLSYTRQKQDEMRGRTLMNLRVANSA